VDTGTIIGFALTIVVTIISVVGSGIGLTMMLVRHINGTRLELKEDIKTVREASETAHRSILADLGEAKADRAAFSERLKCVEDKVDDMKRG